MAGESCERDTGEQSTGLRRDIGLTTLVGIGVGSIVGSGVFALPAIMGSVAGPAFILAIVFTGLVTTVLALAYAELGAAFPITGGPYSLPRLALGNESGFVIGWGYFLYAFIGTAAIISIFVTYLNFYVPGLAVGQTLTPLGILIAVAALWIFTAINVLGVRWGGLFSLVTTVGKLLPLLLFAAIGLAFFQPGNFTPLVPFGLTGITLAMAFGFWAFTGFESVVIPSEEVRRPERNIPLAMLLTILIVIVVYVFIGVSFTGIINWPGLGATAGDWAAIGELSSPLADVSQAQGLVFLAALATIGALISTAGAGGNWVLLQGRIPFAMAKDGLFWGPMQRIHPRFCTPYVSLIFAAILTMVIQIAIPNFPSVALIASITALVPYAAASLSLPILRRTRPEVKRPFRLPFPTAISGLGFVLATLLVYWASWPWTLVGGILMLLGFPLYRLVHRGAPLLAQNVWLGAYLVGIMILSYIGDPNFVFQNFLPIGPLGILTLPYDVVVVAVFAAVIFVWANHRGPEPEQAASGRVSP